MTNRTDLNSEPTPGGGFAYQMPKYRCHKEVYALKIKRITPNPDGKGFVIYPEEEGAPPTYVSTAYFEKHLPKDGGYYVLYKDGYESFSPAEAFEDGYALIAEGHLCV